MIKAKTILSAVLLLASSAMFAQKNLPSNFHLTKLKNGLEVLVIEDNSVPLVTVEIAVHNGAFTEDSAYNGLSHMYEHMFFKANKALPSQEKFLERVKELGIVFNGTTGDERVNYFFTLSNSKVNEGLEFMKNAIMYPLFLEEEMKKENPVVDGEFQRGESDPTFHLFMDWSKNMWGDLYTRKNGIGIHDVILSCTPEKMRAIQAKYYYPNNSILVVAGDVKHDEIFKKADELLGAWKPSDFDIWAKNPVPEFKPLSANKTFITINENAKVPIVMMGWQGPDTRKDIQSTYAADVFSTICGLTSSKFQQQLVDAGLAFNANIGYQTYKYVGPIQVFLVPNPQKIKEAQAKLNEIINSMDADDFFSDEQLQTAKNQLIIQDTYSKEKTSSFIHTVTFWWASASLDYFNSYNENVKKVSRDDIKKYVRQYIKGQPYCAGLLLSPKMQSGMNINSFEDLSK